MTRYANLYELHQRHTIDLLHILDTIGQRGIRVDTERLAEFNSGLDRELEAIQARLEQDEYIRPIRRWHPSTGYKKPPTKKNICMVCLGLGVNGTKTLKNGKVKPVKCKECVKGWRRVEDTEGLELAKFLLIPKEGGAGQYVERWAKRKPFLPTSYEQVLDYVRSRKHRIPLVREGEETTSQKLLLLAWRKYDDQNYKDFVEYRRIKKLRGTYGEWPLVERDGLTFVTTLFTLRPDTGRLSSLQPNVQNIPKDNERADRFRKCLVARPGHKLVRADLESAEAFLTGWLAGSPDYMRLARLGTHKFFMAKYLKEPVSLEMTDEELKPILAKMKKRDPGLYRQIKTIVYGSNYLAGPRKIYENNPEDFTSQAEAARFQNFVKSQDPKIIAWQNSVIARARKEKRLVNPFGYRKEFWDIPGVDGPAAVAFLPQSIVAAIMRECMLQLWPMTAGQFMIWQIHDELVFDVPEHLVDIVVKEVKEVMNQEWPELGGLRIGVSVSVSEDMG